MPRDGRKRSYERNRTIARSNVGRILRREFAAELTAGEGRTVDVRIVPYGERITHNDGLGPVPVGVDYEEEWLPGVFSHQVNAANRVRGELGAPAGDRRDRRPRARVARSATTGSTGRSSCTTTTAGDKALMMVKRGRRRMVSRWRRSRCRNITKGGLVQRAKAHLRAIALTRFAAFSGARILAVREEAVTLDAEICFRPPTWTRVVERCRRLGVRLPQRYQAHPDADRSTPPMAAPLRWRHPPRRKTTHSDLGARYGMQTQS